MQGRGSGVNRPLSRTANATRCFFEGFHREHSQLLQDRSLNYGGRERAELMGLVVLRKLRYPRRPQKPTKPFTNSVRR